MSYTKQHQMAEMERYAARAELPPESEEMEIERLRWELDRAVSNLVEALMRAEKRRNDDAGRRADEAIAAGHNPF